MTILSTLLTLYNLGLLGNTSLLGRGRRGLVGRGIIGVGAIAASNLSGISISVRLALSLGTGGLCRGRRVSECFLEENLFLFLRKSFGEAMYRHRETSNRFLTEGMPQIV